MDERDQKVTEFKQRAVAYFEYLNQGEQWQPKEGKPVRITAMGPRWRRNAAAFLLRRADWAHLHAWGMVFAASGVLAPDPLSHAADALDGEIEATTAHIHDDPAAFLATTPLYRALMHGLDVDEPSQSAEPPVRHLSECALNDESLAHLGCTCRDDSPEWTT
jgi:hypothetical protein